MLQEEVVAVNYNYLGNSNWCCPYLSVLTTYPPVTVISYSQSYNTKHPVRLLQQHITTSITTSFHLSCSLLPYLLPPLLTYIFTYLGLLSSS